MTHHPPPDGWKQSDASPLLRRLRAETREAHERLEHGLALTERPLSRARYAALLERFFGFHAAHEPLLGALFAGEPFWPPRRRLEPLVQDLRLLGRTDRDISALPRCRVPALADRPSAFGCLYVFEGATLGGQVIARHLARQGDVPAAATAYFAGRGRQAGPMWRETCALIEREVSTAAHDAAVAAAHAVFVALHDWLMPPLGGERM